MRVAAAAAAAATLVCVVGLRPSEMADQAVLRRTVRLVLSIRDHYHTACVFLAHGGAGLRQQPRVLRLQRLLAEEGGLPTAAVPLSEYAAGNAQLGACTNNVPLHVLADTGRRARRALCKVSADQLVAARLWLAVLGAGQSAAAFLGCARLSFSLEFMVARPDAGNRTWRVTDFYRVADGGRLLEGPYGDLPWDGDLCELQRRPVWPSPELYLRRNSLHGHRVNAAVQQTYSISPYNMAEDINIYFTSIWKTLMEQKNFTSNTIKLDGSGHQTSNGSWTGVMGALTSGAADISATLSYMSSQRAHAVRFIYPLFSTKFVAVLRQPRAAVGWQLYGSPFEARLWLVVAAVVVGASLLLLLTVRAEAPLHPPSPPRPDIGVVDALLLVLGILCQQGLSGHELRSAASRLSALSVLVPAVVLSAAYSAKLVSSLAVRRVQSAFSTVHQLYRLGYHRVAVIEHSAAHVIFLTSSDETLRALYWSRLSVLPSRPYALRWACSDPRHVLIDGGSYLCSHLDDIRCTLMAVPLDMPGITITAAVAPNSSYGDFFNYVLQVVGSSGLLSRELGPQSLLRKLSSGNGIVVLGPGGAVVEDASDSSKVQVTLESVASLLLLLGCGVAAAVAVAAAERLRACLRSGAGRPHNKGRRGGRRPRALLQRRRTFLKPREYYLF